MKRDKKKGRKDTENATMQAVCSIRMRMVFTQAHTKKYKGGWMLKHEIAIVECFTNTEHNHKIIFLRYVFSVTNSEWLQFTIAKRE